MFAISRYSRFRVFNSRLEVLREFAGKSQICLIVLAAKMTVLRGKVINSRLYGKNREWRRSRVAAVSRAWFPCSFGEQEHRVNRHRWFSTGNSEKEPEYERSRGCRVSDRGKSRRSP